jgi:hypothetical protein
LSPSTSTCAAIEYYAKTSPVSLILEDGYDVEAHQAVVAFPVNLEHRDKFYTWKASSKAPLLVYEPEHKGIVTSPTQLFGNWTFGGQRVASREPGAVATEWANGYVALASLDENGDEKIAGDELKPLALWFDANQNAVAESGEVQDLARHRITELYFSPDQRNEGAHSISASKGFKRVVDGKEVYGRSVDWYAAASESIDSLMQHAMFDRDANGERVSQAPTGDGPTKDAALGGSLGISGIWEWKASSSADISDRDVPNGIFIIGEDEGGGISVNSMALGGASDTSSSAEMVMFSVVDMTGRVVGTSEGDSEIEFSSFPELGAVSVHSKATLKDNGTRLIGYSEAVSIDASGSAKTIRYEWSAIRQHAQR